MRPEKGTILFLLCAELIGPVSNGRIINSEVAEYIDFKTLCTNTGFCELLESLLCQN
jgi:hypothetical protein